MKNKDHQTREDEVANLGRTWMSKILTNIEKMGATPLLYISVEKKKLELGLSAGSGSGRKKVPDL